MPHLVQMDKKYKEKGLVLVLPESQRSPVKSIKAILKKNKAEFTVTNGIRGPAQVRGIPLMLVFDVAGNVVFKGHPNDPGCEKAIKSALKEATPSGDGDGSSDSFDRLPARKILVVERAWTNAEGKAITASLLELNGTEGQFRRPNGQTFEYDITKLSEADQEVIKAAAGSGEAESE